MSIPVGFLVGRRGDRNRIVVSFVGGTAGALSFALHPTYEVAVPSLFVMGAGMAALQVVINPMLRVAGGEEHFAFNSAFAQLVFGAASFVSPLVFSYLVTNLSVHPVPAGALLGVLARVTPAGLPWVSIYWLFALSTIVMALVIAALKLTKVERTAEESAGTLAMYKTLLRNPIIWAYFFCIIAYVGSEQGTADWMSEFLHHYHGYDPHVAGAGAVSKFWGLLTLGCLAGMVLLKLLDSRRVLVGFSLAALLMLTLALFGPARGSL